MINIHHGKALEVLTEYPEDYFDLAFTSPPYEDARSYNLGFRLVGDAWVEWCAEHVLACLRVTKGLVCFVVEGRTRNYSYSNTPARLSVYLQDRGVFLRKPCVFQRHGIPGSGGPDYLRNDWEYVLVFQKEQGKLPWSDNKAAGSECKYPSGGAMSNRTQDGQRRNAKTGRRLIGNNGRPEITNPGNVVRGKVGKGHMGSDLAHENEAPFPEWLIEPFIKSFCPPGGIVLDPFCGSGTTLAVAQRLGRQAVGIDVRADQVELTRRRSEAVEIT